MATENFVAGISNVIALYMYLSRHLLHFVQNPVQGVMRDQTSHGVVSQRSQDDEHSPSIAEQGVCFACFVFLLVRGKCCTQVLLCPLDDLERAPCSKLLEEMNEKELPTPCPPEKLLEEMSADQLLALCFPPPEQYLEKELTVDRGGGSHSMPSSSSRDMLSS